MTDQTTLYVAASVDGYTADGGVAGRVRDPGYEPFVESVDCLATGARTYEQIRGFGAWPCGDRRTCSARGSAPPGATRPRLTGRRPRSFLRPGATDDLRPTVVLGGGVALFGEGGVRRRLDLREVTERARNCGAWCGRGEFSPR